MLFNSLIYLFYVQKMSFSRREYEDFKNAVDKIVYKYVTRDRSTIVSLITHSVDFGTEKRKLEDKLSSYVDKNIAFKLADKTFAALDSLGIKPKSSSKKRSHRDDSEKDVKRVRHDEKVESLNDVSKPSLEPKIVMESVGETPQSPGILQAQQIKDLMAKAQATIEERKRALALQGQAVPAISNGTSAASIQENHSSASQMVTESVGSGDVSSRIAQLQARIQAQLGNNPVLTNSAMIGGRMPQVPQMPSVPQQGYFPNMPPPLMSQPPLIPAMKNPTNIGVPSSAAFLTPPKSSTEQSMPTPLILDSEGRTVDMCSGKEVHLALRVPTLKANIRAKKREEFKQQLLEKPVEESTELHFFDLRVPAKPFTRNKRTFKFHEQGKYIQLAQRERAKSRLEKLQQQISQVAKKTGISSAAKLAQLEQRDAAGTAYNITPNVEWWDAIILEKDRYPVEGDPVKLKEDFITSLVEHPMEMKCPNDLAKAVELQVRMANLMRVLGTEAVLDPTKMEKHVREQMAKRLKAHEDANAARKLTPEQKRDKKIKKLKEGHYSWCSCSYLQVGKARWIWRENKRKSNLREGSILNREIILIKIIL
ncbi:U4/U6 small nuclear ribonucleoprotein Prp3 [Armadillidium nasatum]|uniref:U4/U6 small nuclear ribonucleoprotein Prp3 n=2 Tax=Armadillidium nasatum TaxID=96803 RepID=A0A5N5TPA0_9CRUS|nr:U4/U6 small nuclear ribonucleoprotein Prp3 [Armadillidium nasatum]